MSACLATLTLLARSSKSMMGISEAMLEVIHDITLPIKVLNIYILEAKMCSSTLQRIKNASERNRSINCLQGFVTFFENWHDIGHHQICWELPCLQGSLKMGTIFSLSFFSRRGFSLSGPATSPGLMLFYNLRSPNLSHACRRVLQCVRDGVRRQITCIY